MMRCPITEMPEPPLPANDIPMVVMIGPQTQLRLQRALHWRIGVRFLGFRHGDTALLALMTMRCDAILVSAPADMAAGDFLGALRAEGHSMPVALLGGETPVPESAAGLRSLLVRLGVLHRPLRAVG